jgi:hypothetical protein
MLPFSHLPGRGRPGSGYTGQVGEAIVVRASDDFEVEGVNVSLTDAGGNALESGEAVETPLPSSRLMI